MVQLASYGKLLSEAELPIRKSLLPAATKLEIEDQLDDEHSPLSKRSKPAHPSLQQWGTCESKPVPEVLQNNLLNEPSPLGLRLRKSPSLLDLIQMRLSQVNATANSCSEYSKSLEDGKKKDTMQTGTFLNNEKVKASNFPASLLRIGTWEYTSRYEGDLVAKFYFAKKKLVWEILEGGLKSKIEIQWSDIAALKSTCQEHGTATLDIVLSRQPLFFRETNPQPRKHTLWQATSDFTDGQASIHRRHFLQCTQGLMSKNLEKLIQFDPRLYALSQEPNIVLENPFFETRCSAFEDPDQESKFLTINRMNTHEEYKDASLACAAAAEPVMSRIANPAFTFSDASNGETHPPCSVLESPATRTRSIMTKNQTSWDQLKVPGLKPSMSISDFMNQIGNCISGQMSPPDSKMLEEMVQSLFSDSQMPSDERSVLSKVNSFCCLLQKDAGSVQNQQMDAAGSSIGYGGYSSSTPEQCNNPAAMSRKDSFGELLMQLPRIASLPQFLFDIAEVEEDDGFPV